MRSTLGPSSEEGVLLLSSPHSGFVADVHAAKLAVIVANSIALDRITEIRGHSISGSRSVPSNPFTER